MKIKVKGIKVKSKTIDKLALIYIKDQRVLSVRSKGNAAYYIPGGKRKGKETDQEALIREVKEELNVDLIKKTIKHFKDFETQAHNKLKGVIVKMSCYTAKFKGEPKASNKIEEVVYLKHNYRYEQNCPPVGKLVLDYLKNKNLIK
jgi:8-oxo-dGTP pyrophosphatase MutT (NUDIX family)